MTQYFYLAALKKLPTGSFGSNPVSAKQPHVFRTELDFTHLFFENNMDEQSKKRFSFSPHLSLEHQVAFSHNFLPLKNELKGNSIIEEKCLNILYLYIEEALQMSRVVEYFSSLNGKEDLPFHVKKAFIGRT
jgi:hypothetical protein